MTSIKRFQIADIKKFDKTGLTSYTKEDLEKILSDFFKNARDFVYFTDTNSNFKENSLKTKEKFEIKDEMLETFEENLKDSLIYLGYHDGNFKWANYLLIGESTLETEGNVKNGYLYLFCENKDGRIFSALSEEISEYGKTTKEDSNILKMMKRNGYSLVNNDQKKFAFGKGHLVAGNLKNQVKGDLNLIFGIMTKSKEKAQKGDLTKLDIANEVSSMNYFKFKKD